MSKLEYDEHGFTCECGTRHDYPAYVYEHRHARLLHACTCKRQYLLHRGTVQKVSRETSDIMDSEGFGD